MAVSKSICDGELIFFLKWRKSVRIIVWSKVVQEDANTLIFYIFKYSAEYDAECSDESGAKYYFMVSSLSW